MKEQNRNFFELQVCLFLQSDSKQAEITERVFRLLSFDLRLFHEEF